MTYYMFEKRDLSTKMFITPEIGVRYQFKDFTPYYVSQYEPQDEPQYVSQDEHMIYTSPFVRRSGRLLTEENKKELYIIPDFFSGSDFSGDSVNVSNFRAFLESYGKEEGVLEFFGGFGTYGIAIRVDVAENHTEIKKILDQLSDYGVMDDDLWSLVQNEWEDKSMPDILRDVINELEKSIPDYEELLVPEETVLDFIFNGIQILNIDWIEECNKRYINSDEVFPYAEDKILLQHSKDLPLLTNRKWSCKETQQEYEEKLKSPTR